jgi:hypothetical protein
MCKLVLSVKKTFGLLVFFAISCELSPAELRAVECVLEVRHRRLSVAHESEISDDVPGRYQDA